MKLEYLANSAGCCVDYLGDIEILGLSMDSRKAKKGDLFFWINGKKIDYLNEAVANGVSAVVSAIPLKNISVPYILTQDIRRCMAIMSSIFYNHPKNNLKIVAVTGTNGKTSIVNMLYEVGTKMNYKCGVIGTLGIRWGDNVLSQDMTTPDTIDLHRIFRNMANDEVEYVFMEASAHAIFLDKLYGLDFECVVFTNLTQDHLDYFENMEKYKNAKCGIFLKNYVKNIVVNTDDNAGMEICNNYRNKCLSYGIYKPADVFAIDITQDRKLQCIINVLDNMYYLDSYLVGICNVYNAMATLCVANCLKWNLDSATNQLNKIEPIIGRLNIYGNNKKIIVDYAHTPDALKNLLSTAMSLANRVITVFGCGGDRDKDKRSKMGKIATDMSDYVIITEDNSRSEKVIDICNDIARGIDKSNYEIIEDRESAISKAYQIENDGDILVIAGKGAEEYIDRGIEKIRFSDIEYVHKLLGEEIK